MVSCANSGTPQETNPDTIEVLDTTFFDNAEVTADQVAPTVPSDLTIALHSPTFVKITWMGSTDNIGVVGYKVFDQGEEIGTATTLTFNHDGLVPGSTHCYRVKAFDLAGNVSALSNEACITLDLLADAIDTDSTDADAMGCTEGYHDGGTGNCVVVGTCEDGFHDDGLGDCVSTGCASGYHDGGDKTCVLGGMCSPGYYSNGQDVCVETGCAIGYHDGGNGECVQSSTCSDTYHDDGTGRCVTVGCASGYHDDGTGACAALGCTEGYHAGGDGNCLQTGTCSCLVDGCSPGYYPGGTDNCLQDESCWCVAVGCSSPTYHDNGAGVCVPEPMFRAKAIVGGGNHMCALTSDGGVKCWGENIHGQLGDDTTTDSPRPVDVVGLSEGIVAITAGGDYAGIGGHSCAITSAKTVKCWGANEYGQLGLGDTNDRHTPVEIAGLSDVKALTAGWYHTCALMEQGTVKCWGSNYCGALGTGDTTDSSTPVDVTNLSGEVSIILAGGQLDRCDRTCAVLVDNSLKCWGHNDGLIPTAMNLPANVRTAGIGEHHVCAAMRDSGVQCWGWNCAGQTGHGNVCESCWEDIPTEVASLTGINVVEMTGGWGHTCALTSEGGVKCWGTNERGQLGDGIDCSSLGGIIPYGCYSSMPVDVSGFTSGAINITSGVNFSCARTDSGIIKCWGANSSGQLGDGTFMNRFVPVEVNGF